MSSKAQTKNSITIDTGEIRLLVNGDENRVITFNPEDLTFIENLYSLLAEFPKREKLLNEKMAELEKSSETDQSGVPASLQAQLALTRETCDYLRREIDEIFGPGTSQAAFGSANTMDMFAQFFTGITPFIQKKRQHVMKKYEKNGSNVMKA